MKSWPSLNVSKHDILYQSQPAYVGFTSYMPYRNTHLITMQITVSWPMHSQRCGAVKLNESKVLIPTDDLDRSIQYFKEAFSDAAVRYSDFYIEDTCIAKCTSTDINDDWVQCCIWIFKVYLSILTNWNHTYLIYITVFQSQLQQRLWTNEILYIVFELMAINTNLGERRRRVLFIRQYLSDITLNDATTIMNLLSHRSLNWWIFVLHLERLSILELCKDHQIQRSQYSTMLWTTWA